MGSASGVVNVGGFVASLLTILAIGVVLDLLTPGRRRRPTTSARSRPPSRCSTCSGRSGWSACSGTAGSCARGWRRRRRRPGAPARRRSAPGCGAASRLPLTARSGGGRLRLTALRAVAGGSLHVQRRAMERHADRGPPLPGLAALAGVAARDLIQREHTLLRNFPVIGHARYLLEAIGPGAAAVPRRGQQRGAAVHPRPAAVGLRLGEEGEQLLRLRHRQRPRVHRRLPGHQPPDVRPGRAAVARRRAGTTCALPCGQGAGRGPRAAARRSGPTSVVNISAMSFGSLSGAAVEALNRGAALAGCLHNTGEGGLSPHHRHGGELVFQIGTAYFGCRDDDGRFDLQRLKDLVAGAPVRALEIKLSQGAKPGLGGVLPGGEGVGRDRRDPRRARRAWTASARPGTPSSPTPTACSTGSSCSPPRPGCRSASSPPSATWAFWDELTDLHGAAPAAASTS